MKNSLKTSDLQKLGFKELGCGWFSNEMDDIRIRLWKEDEVDFWRWRNSENLDENQVHFRGKVFSMDEVKWILERCFNVMFGD